MQTRREQVRAYRFTTRRIVSAMLIGEPESLDLPMRRLGMALVGSLIAAAILLAGVGAYGLSHPDGGAPKDNSVVIERETGARYVYLSGTLYPVYNFASALLILHTAQPAIETMSRNSLGALPRYRQTYGIVDAPDSLPDPAALSGLPWTVCTSPGPTGPATPVTRLTVGKPVPGGSDLGDAALLVQVIGTTSRYLLWHNHALRIAGPVTQAALGMAGAAVLEVGSAFINGTMAGPDLRIPKIDGDGLPSNRTVSGKPATIGSVYHDEHGKHYVLLTSGLAVVGDPMADLVKASGRPDNQITSAVAGRMLSDKLFEPPGFPDSLPRLLQPNPDHAALCTVYRSVADASVLIYDQVPAQLVPSTGEASRVQTDRSIRTADFLTVDRGALVKPVPAPGATSVGNTVFLVSPQGIRYALETRGGDAKAALGYGAVTPLPVPLALVELIPLGPTLDVAVAQRSSSQSSTQPITRPTSPAASPSRP